MSEAAEVQTEAPKGPAPANDPPLTKSEARRQARLARAQSILNGNNKPKAEETPAEPPADESKAEAAEAEPEKAEAAEPEKPAEEPEAEKKPEPIDEDKLAKAANEIVQDLKANPEVARPILTKLLKQGITGTYIELKKWTKTLNGKELQLNNGHAALGKEREAFEADKAKHAKEMSEWADLVRKQPREAARRLNLTLRNFADEAALQDEPEEKRRLREIEERWESDRKAREEERTAEKKKLEELEAKLSQREAADLERQDRAWVSSAWETKKSDYPYLVAYDSNQILESAYLHLKDLHNKGELDPTVDRERVFAKMNQWAEGQKAEGNWTEAQLKRFAQANPTPVANKAGASERANGQADKANPAAQKKEAPTLSNADASERASPPRAMNRAQRLEHAKRRYAGR